MKVVAIAMVRDEADVIGDTVAHMLTQVDEVIVADNRSRDETPAILANLDVEVVCDDEPAYRQSEKMTRLAAIAGTRGADWIVPFDADEWWYSPFGRIGDVLGGVAPQWLVAEARLYDHVATATDRLGSPVGSIGWRRREPTALPKVACRWRPDLVIAQGNHAASYEGGATVRQGLLVVRHFPYRSAEQFVRKARNGAEAYLAAEEIPPDIGAHWRGYGAVAAAYGDEACADIFRRWFWSPDPASDPSLIYDPVVT